VIGVAFGVGAIAVGFLLGIGTSIGIGYYQYRQWRKGKYTPRAFRRG
jgi:uncharacterized membrane protein